MGLWRDRAGVVEAAVLVTAAKVAVAVLPFDWVGRVLGERGEPSVGGGPELPFVAKRCRLFVTVAARRLPYEVSCLPQAIAGQLMLRRRGLEGTVVFGLAREHGDWLNHAWLEYQGRTVLGGLAAIGYVPMVGYSRPAKGS
ncbi:MAG: hypothetical protein JWM05_3427 [Acidimicrobiales bacterium]|nr:hypothetical protein [Acidimicrobiales bacterium]